MHDLRYLHDKPKFLSYVCDVLGKHYSSSDVLIEQFEAISDDSGKNEFLRIVSFYNFLVVDGRFVVAYEGEEKYVDHIDETYKFIAIMALIEALYSDEPFTDFYDWLKRRDHADEFPIDTRDKLDDLHRRYKSEHGSIQKAIRFFTSLDSRFHWVLMKGIRYYNKTATPTGEETVVSVKESIEEIAKTLYLIRSEFVHHGKLVLEVGKALLLSRRGNRYLITDLSLDDVCFLFEQGVMAHFGLHPDAPSSPSS